MKIILLAAVLSFGGGGATVEWQGPDPIVQKDMQLPLCADTGGQHRQHLNYDTTEHLFTCGS